MNPHFATFKARLARPLSFRLFLLTQLPVAYFAGLRLAAFEETHASITVRYKWFNKNPFRSMYFAVLAMAGEVSTGILAMGALYKRQPSVSMLLVSTEGKFFKKAVGRIVFTCSASEGINAAVEQALSTGEGTTCACEAVGKNEAGEVVASFVFTWSFKGRKQ